MYHVGFLPNRYCLKILQETLLNSVLIDLLPFMVGHSHDSFYTAECQGGDAISALSAGHASAVHEEQTWVSSNMFKCP
jgi:hypothetical protein